MQSYFVRFICRMLTASMIVLPLHAQAGVIGTGEAVAADAEAARAAVARFIGRGEVARQLQALGLSAQAASERVAALSDAEVAGLADRIEALPAGGVAGLMAIFAVVFVVYILFASPEAMAREAPKPKPKPAPEKK